MSEIVLLREAVRALDGPVFAVLDGAQFADLPDALLRAGLRHRSLYLDRGDNHPERLVTAPQMVGPLDGEVLDRTLALLDTPSPAAAVFWLCLAGADSLYRHLRGINMVRIPRPSVDASRDYERDPARPKRDDEDDTHETVLFRHADANVMAQIAPALEAPQLARLVGPADALFFLPGSDWRDPAARSPVRILRKQTDWPRSQGGLLTIRPSEVAAIEGRRLTMARVRRASFLRKTCQTETDGASDEAVARHIQVSEETGHDLGLVSEGAHCRWAFVMCKTNGRVLHSKEATDFISRGGNSPDKQVQLFMEGVAEALKTRVKEGRTA